ASAAGEVAPSRSAELEPPPLHAVALAVALAAASASNHAMDDLEQDIAPLRESIVSGPDRFRSIGSDGSSEPHHRAPAEPAPPGVRGSGGRERTFAAQVPPAPRSRRRALRATGIAAGRPGPPPAGCAWPGSARSSSVSANQGDNRAPIRAPPRVPT